MFLNTSDGIKRYGIHSIRLNMTSSLWEIYSINAQQRDSGKLTSLYDDYDYLFAKGRGRPFYSHPRIFISVISVPHSNTPQILEFCLILPSLS